MKKFPFYILYTQTNLGIVVWFSWFFYWTLSVFPTYSLGHADEKRMWIYYVKILAIKIIDVIKIILCFIHLSVGFPSGSVVKNSPAGQELQEMGFDPWVGKIPWRRAWQPTPVFCLENPIDNRAWWAAVRRVAKSQTRLKWLHTHTHTHTRLNVVSSPHTHTSKCCVPHKIREKFFLVLKFMQCLQKSFFHKWL